MNQKQKDFLCNKFVNWERGEGLTTILIIDIILRYEHSTIKNVSEIVNLSDIPDDLKYSMGYYKKLFLEIYQKLRLNGFALRRVVI